MEKEYRNPDDYWYYYGGYEKKSKKRLGGCLFSLTGIIIITLVSLLLYSCQTKYITVPEYHYETILKTDSFIQKDSIYCWDSTYVENSGDTVTTYKIRIVYKDRWKEVVKIDSIVKVDSVRVPYPVEKKLTKWQKFKMQAGGAAMIFCLFVIVLFVVCWLIKKKRLMN